MNFKNVFAVVALAALVIIFQNCSQTTPEGSADGSSVGVTQIDGDITILSKPVDTTLYVGTKSAVGALARSERGFPLVYEWYKDGVKIDVPDSSLLELNNVAATDAGKYELRIKNSVDSTQVEFNVAVSNSPVVQIRTQPQPLEIMNGQPGTLSVVADISDPAVTIRYQWYRYGQAIPGATSSSLSIPNWSIAQSGFYHVEVWNSLGVKTVIPSNGVGVSVGFETSVVGCANYAVPAGITKLRVTTVGGGGGGGRSYSYLAYNLLSGGGGAAVEAIATLPANTTTAAYCVGAGGAPDANGTASTFMTIITANGGEKGNGWHYRGEDGRGTPPSLGGTFAINTAVAQTIRSANGQNVTSFGACGGNAGFAVDAARSGLGACSASENGRLFGGGGWGNGSFYSNGSPTSGAGGYVKIAPSF